MVQAASYLIKVLKKHIHCLFLFTSTGDEATITIQQQQEKKNKIPFSTFPGVFDPSLHEGNTYQAFKYDIEAGEMSYYVACIGELKEDAFEIVQKQHKAKVFRMCVFQGERLKTDLKSEFNQDLAQLKQADFNTMVQRLCNRYRPPQNQVTLH